MDKEDKKIVEDLIAAFEDLNKCIEKIKQSEQDRLIKKLKDNGHIRCANILQSLIDEN